MDNRAKLLKIGMWTLVVISLLLFVVIIIVGHSISIPWNIQVWKPS